LKCILFDFTFKKIVYEFTAQVSKVILTRGCIAVLSWQVGKTRRQCSRRGMHSSARCAERTHLSVVGTIHSCVGTLQFAGRCSTQKYPFWGDVDPI